MEKTARTWSPNQPLVLALSGSLIININSSPKHLAQDVNVQPTWVSPLWLCQTERWWGPVCHGLRATRLDPWPRQSHRINQDLLFPSRHPKIGPWTLNLIKTQKKTHGTNSSPCSSLSFHLSYIWKNPPLKKKGGWHLDPPNILRPRLPAQTMASLAISSMSAICRVTQGERQLVMKICSWSVFSWQRTFRFQFCQWGNVSLRLEACSTFHCHVLLSCAMLLLSFANCSPNVPQNNSATACHCSFVKVQNKNYVWSLKSRTLKAKDTDVPSGF